MVQFNDPPDFLTLDMVREAMEQDYIGICLACAHEQGCCEPDAREYKCESCEEYAVFGAEEILVMYGDLLY